MYSEILETKPWVVLARQLDKALLIFLLLLALISASTSVLAANPTVPGNLRSSIYSSTAAELFWDASTDADGVASYRIYIAGVLYREVAGPSMFIDVLHPGKRYDFQVSAVDRTGSESRWTEIYPVIAGGTVANSDNTLVEAVVVEEVAVDEVSGAVNEEPAESATPVAQQPVVNVIQAGTVIKPPVGITTVRQSDDSVAVVWEADPGSAAVAGYNLYLGTSYIATSSSADYEIKGLNADSSYRLILTAFDFDGNFSTKSEVVVISTLPQGVSTGVSAESDTNSATTTAENAAVETTAADQDSVVDNEISLAGTAIEETQSNQAEEIVVEPNAVVPDEEPTQLELVDASVVDLEQPATLTEDTDLIDESESGDASEAAEAIDDMESEPSTPMDIIDPNDFFGHTLELDNEETQAGAAPTKPKNLRANLVSNDWVELNWAPSNDDGEVVAYRIHRDDGVMYSISAADESGDIETNKTLMNFWLTTTYVDCNFTHVQECNDNQTTPEVGALHTYRVSAVDDEGNESALSDPLTVQMHERQGAIVEPFEDPYLDRDDEFLFVTDLSDTSNFLDQFELVFSDEFEGDSIDPSKWSTSLTWNQEGQNIINGEMQYFVDTQTEPDFGYDPFIFNGETLTIAAIETPPELLEKAKDQPYLSGALSTHETRSGQYDDDGNLIADKFATTYGYVEGRIRVGQVSGMLTSFYLFRRWAGEHAPEIDIIEYLGENPYGDEKAFQTYHYQDVSHQEILSSPTMQFPPEDGHLSDFVDLDGFHTYSVLWEPGLVIWYIDGMEVQRLTGRQIGRQSMNIILYLVAGSAWAPKPAADAPFPLEIEIDYVRAYKRKPWQGSPNNG